MVSDSKDIIPRTIRAHNLGAGSVTTAKVGKKIIHTAAADPTAASDAGTGYEVGSLWNNTSSGEIFICTDSSEENSIWYGQEGENVNLTQYTGGSATGYIYGGTPAYDGIESLSFSSDGDSTDTSDEMTENRYGGAGAKSSTYMFAAGDYGPSSPTTETAAIDSYTISSPHTYADWGEITQDAGKTLFSSHNDSSYAWTAGGYPAPSNTIQKFATNAAASTTDVGELATAIRNQVGLTDTIGGYGYTCGGDNPSPAQINEIQRFSLTSDGNADDVGDLTQVTGVTSGGASETHGFCVEGVDPSATDINKFAWGSSGNATDVAEASRVMNSGLTRPGLHTTTHWYQTGGYTHPATSAVDTIDKISFTAPYPLTDVGEIIGGARESMYSASV